MKFIDLDTFIFALAFTLQNLKVGCNGFGFKKKKIICEIEFLITLLAVLSLMSKFYSTVGQSHMMDYFLLLNCQIYLPTFPHSLFYRKILTPK